MPSRSPAGNQEPVGSNCWVLGRAVEVLCTLLPEVEVPVDDCVHFGLCNFLFPLFLYQVFGYTRLLRRCPVAGQDAVQQFFLAGGEAEERVVDGSEGPSSSLPAQRAVAAADGCPSLVAQLATVSLVGADEQRVAWLVAASNFGLREQVHVYVIDAWPLLIDKDDIDAGAVFSRLAEGDRSVVCKDVVLERD